jgi:hypothetical protein
MLLAKRVYESMFEGGDDAGHVTSLSYFLVLL